MYDDALCRLHKHRPTSSVMFRTLCTICCQPNHHHELHSNQPHTSMTMFLTLRVSCEWAAVIIVTDTYSADKQFL